MHRDSRRITRTGTTNVVTASCHTVFPPRLIGALSAITISTECIELQKLPRDVQTL